MQQQQQQQQYGNYPYYGQPMYPPHTPYMGASGPPGPSNGYPPFYGPPNPQPPAQAPQNPNPPAPSPYSFDAAAYAVKPGTGTTSQSRRHRRNQTIPAPAAAAPLKSAMKKTMNNVMNTAETSIARQFSNSFGQSQPQNAPPPHNRSRVYSNPPNPQNMPETLEPDAPPFHMLVSFHGYNEIHIENIMKLALEEVRKVIWPQWPDGIESDTVIGHKCVVRFRNAPWDLSGANVKHAYKLIVEFFKLFQTRGYSFQTAVNIATATPRLIFQVTQPDPNAEFFLAYFSQDGRRVTLMNPPNHIEYSMGARLRNALPRNLVADRVVEESNRVIEVKRKPGSIAPDVEPAIYFVEVLKILSHLGFQLDATVPLGRRGPLGIRYTRELLIFKGSLPQS
ncbi:hypothetical protein B0H34DRAFT_792758 [Crassisporium funariophilum]|nr:hypothetical protein B0H34DRAFT_792758 [Crassisporium funariophilum]